jgi:small-conductance mechanosensitive channel
LEDDLAVLQVERQVSQSQKSEGVDADGNPLARVITRHSSRAQAHEPEDEFDTATRALHEQTAKYKPPENPSTGFARFFKKVHESSFLVRYFTYITPVVLILLIPLLVGALAFPDAHVGGVQLTWFAIWLEIFWLTLWAGRLAAKCIPGPVFILASLFTNNAKKWRDLARQLELPAALFFWWLGIEISFLPTMTNHHIRGPPGTKHWEVVVNKIIISIFVGTTLNLIEKLIIQLIAIGFHLRTYADRIEINTFQIGSLAKLYAHSKEHIAEDDDYFAEKSGGTTRSSGARTPLQYAHQAQKAAKDTLTKITDVAGVVAGDFTGKKVVRSNHPHQVVLTLLSSNSGSQVLARRLYRTFVREGFDTVFSGDLKSAFENGEEAEAAFAMFDKDMNGDISMEELEAVCVEIGRERKSIMASLKDLDSVVSKLDDVFLFIVLVITVLVFLSLISTSTAGVLTSAGSTLLALSWLFSATAQELLASIIFVFVK